ncbi:MAG: response regulator transcription factor [Patescibacteria group bacterium]
MKVLVVEDERSIRDFLKQSLEREHFAVDIAEDGIKGTYLAKTNEYDVILLDNVTPGKHGQMVCADVRAAGKTTPIISLSVQSDLTTKLALLNAGVDDYITKPFSFLELLARIHAVLRRPREFQGDVLHIDDVTIDTRRHTVMRGKIKITLTKKEFMILEYLVRHQNAAVPRSLILEHVWDGTLDPCSNTLETHMFTLRKKIDTNNRKKLIHTVPNVGYKVVHEKNIV